MVSSGLSRALNNVVRELPYHLENLYVFLSEIVATVVVPFATIIAAAVVSWKLSNVILRIVFPPNAAVMQKEALGLLKKGDDRRTVQQAEKLLKKSIKRDPTFLPSHLSLAALQLFQQDCPEACLETIASALKLFPKDPDLMQLQLDAEAVQQNLGLMVRAGSLTIPYLEGIPMK